jgi:hypothetical protein
MISSLLSIIFSLTLLVLSEGKGTSSELHVSIRTFSDRSCSGVGGQVIQKVLGVCTQTADNLTGSLYQCVKKGGLVLQLLGKNCSQGSQFEPSIEKSIRKDDCIFASSINRWVTIRCDDGNNESTIEVDTLVEKFAQPMMPMKGHGHGK